MLGWFFFLLISSAVAQGVPVITAPTGIVIEPGSKPEAMVGISVAGGASPYTISFDCATCVFTASGSTVGGSGTNHLAVGPTTLQGINQALNTLKIQDATSAVYAGYVVNINAMGNGVNGAPFFYAVSVDGRRYLVHPSHGQAVGRSRTQCGAANCDGGSLTGAIAGGTLTVSAVSGGLLCALAPSGKCKNQLNECPPAANLNIPLRYPGNVVGTVVQCQLTGTLGGDGTYQINNSQSISSQSMDYGYTTDWWETISLTDGTAALRIIPGDPCFDAVIAANCGGTGAKGAGNGLNDTEKGQLKSATSVPLPLPSVPQ